MAKPNLLAQKIAEVKQLKHTLNQIVNYYTDIINVMSLAMTVGLNKEGLGKIKIRRIAEFTQDKLDEFFYNSTADYKYACKTLLDDFNEIMKGEELTLRLMDFNEYIDRKTAPNVGKH